MSLRPLTQRVIDTHYASGAWQPRTLVDVVDEIARRRGDALAVADQHQRLSYRELVRRSHALATFLLDQGLKPGSVVALQTPNRTALAVTHLACDRADLTFVPLSDVWRHTEMGHLLRTSGAEVVIVPPPLRGFDYIQMIRELRPSLPDLRAVGVLEGSAMGADFDFAKVSTVESPTVRVERDPNAARFVMITSGTTELPRMSLWSDNNLWFFMSQFRERIGLSENDIAVGLSPANTGAIGYVFPVLGPLLSGASSILLEEWSPGAALDLIERERATTATAVPTQLVKMLQSDDLEGRDFSALRVFTNAGAAMPPHAAERLERVFGCVQHVVYGATDGGVPAMTQSSDPPEKRWHTVGKLTEFGEVRLVDPAGEDVEPGVAGEILWRGPTKSFGYLNDPERTEAAFVGDGWYRSGDLGRLDPDGYLHIVGRVKDVIIRGGQNISPLEVEILLSRHPAIAEVSVVGVPDAVYGERSCACVVPLPDHEVTLASILDFLAAQQVARFKFPERLELFSELPKSAGGKVTKVELRAAVAQRTVIPEHEEL
jgi:non-ribosomal peptide synthetase component E (peptide arylation enzyme)